MIVGLGINETTVSFFKLKCTRRACWEEDVYILDCLMLTME